MTKTIPLILATTAVLLIATVHAGANTSASPRAFNGVMDLRSYDMERSEPVRLDGEWEFYWRQILEPASFRTGNSGAPGEFFTVPGVWNNRPAGDTIIDGDGYATFRLTVLTDGRGGIRTLKIPVMATSYRLYVKTDDCLPPTGDAVDIPRNPQDRSTIRQPLRFELTGNTIEIVMHISNFSSDKGEEPLELHPPGGRNPEIMRLLGPPGFYTSISCWAGSS